MIEVIAKINKKELIEKLGIKNGIDGKDGINGLAGKDGVNGKDGLVGEKGESIDVKEVEKMIDKKIKETKPEQRILHGRLPDPVTIISITADSNESQKRGVRNILVDCTAGNVIVNLNSAIGNSCVYKIKKKDATANTVTIATLGSQTIDGSATHVISVQNVARDVVSDDANWFIV